MHKICLEEINDYKEVSYTLAEKLNELLDVSEETKDITFETEGSTSYCNAENDELSFLIERKKWTTYMPQSRLRYIL